jgi:hypothetical protein
MDKNSTILEIRWGGKNPRIIYEDGSSILFYVIGNYGTDMATWQEKAGLTDFYKLDWDQYHGSSWIGMFNYNLCEWIQSVTLALEKNGIGKSNIYIAIREIFDMKDDPTNEETIDKIYEILIKYFGNVTGDFNKKDWNKEQPNIPGYNFVYRYNGIKDLIAVFLTGYAFHYAKCIRYKPNDEIFNAFRSLTYKNMLYRAVYFTKNEISSEDCRNLPTIYDRHHNRIETKEQTIERIRSNIISTETGIEELLTKNCITVERINLTKEIKDKIAENIDTEILENKKEKTFSFSEYDIFQESEAEKIKEKER